MIFNPLAIFKRQNSTDKVIDSSVRTFDGSGSRGVVHDPFSSEEAVAKFRSWVYIASNIVSNDVARVPLRLFIRNRPGVKRAYLTRPASRRHKQYLRGDMAHKPSRSALIKAAEFGDDFEEVVEEHPAISVLRSANSFMNGFDLTVLRFTFLQLTGDAYMHPIHSAQTGLPEQVWLLPSQWVEIQPDEDELIRGYVYGADEMHKQDFSTDEVIHFRLPNPKSMYYGMGRVEAVWSALGLHEAKRDTDLANFQNRCRPDWIAIVKDAKDQSQLDRFTAAIERRLKGRRKRGNFAAVGGEATFQQMNMPPDIIGDTDRVLDEIAGAFGVPRAKLTGNMNVAGGGSEQADVDFLRSTIHPLLCMDEEKLNEKWLPLFGIEDDAILAYDNPVPDDRTFELSRRSTLVSGGIMTPNEARGEEGLEPVPSEFADQLLIGGQPLGAQQQQPSIPGLFAGPPAALQMRQEPPPAPIAASLDMDELAMTVRREVRRELKKNLKRKEYSHDCECEKGQSKEVATKAIEEEATDADATPGDRASGGADSSEPGGDVSAETDVGKFIDRAFGTSMIEKADAEDDKREGEPEGLGNQLQRAIQDVLNETGAKVRQALTGRRKALTASQQAAIKSAVDAMNASLTEQVRDIIAKIFAEGGEVALQAVMREFERQGIDPPDLSQTPFNPQKAAEEFTTRLSGSVSQTTLDHVRDSVAKSIELGETVQETAERINESGVFSESRAEMIARTESARAFVDGERESWKQSGVVRGKQWLLAPNACEFCKAAAKMFNKQVVGLDDNFFAKGETLRGVDGGTMRLDFDDVKGPPLHPNDRCALIPVIQEG